MENQKRLKSLDLLRGFDLFLLIMFQPIMLVLLKKLHSNILVLCPTLFDHVTWAGVGFWDLIMPLFMFMSGITIPFAMSKYKSGGEKTDGHFYFRLFKRFFILFFMGWIVQGNLLYLDIHQFSFFSNTLQAIAVGYVVAAILYVKFPIRGQIWFAASFFLLYLIIFATFGKMDYSAGSNIAEEIDRCVLGRFRAGMSWENGIVVNLWPRYHYTWILSSLNFIVTVMLGSFAGYVLKFGENPKKRLKALCIIGASLVAAALAMSPVFPIIKHIWSSSMTLFYGGICFFLMALFYYVVDVKGFTKGMEWLKYFGMNSLVVYCISEVVSFRSISNSLFFGLEQYMGEYYPLVGVCFQAFMTLWIAKLLYDRHIFVKA